MCDYKQELSKAQSQFSKLQHHEETVRGFLTHWEKEVVRLEKTQMATDRARVILQTVAAEMQQTLEFHIANIVTMALATVFEDPYEFKVKFETRRNQTEVDFFFVRNGNEIDPIDNSGCGAVDVAALALRMAVWNISKTRALMILDEPMRFLSRDMQSRCSELLSDLSKQLNIQLLVVSHITELIEQADRIFQVKNVGGVSKITVL